MCHLGCFEAGRFTQTQTSRTALCCSRKWMSGPADALTPVQRDRKGSIVALTVGFIHALQILLGSAGRSIFSLDKYLSWMPYGLRRSYEVVVRWMADILLSFHCILSGSRWAAMTAIRIPPEIMGSNPRSFVDVLPTGGHRKVYGLRKSSTTTSNVCRPARNSLSGSVVSLPGFKVADAISGFSLR
jgi:hypothetical protein